MKFEIKEKINSHKSYLESVGFIEPKLSSHSGFCIWVSRNGEFASALNPCKTLRNTPLILKVRLTQNGYRHIRVNGKNMLAHRLIALEFLGDINNRIVHHKNGDRTDNRVENLEITTYKENNSYGWSSRENEYQEFIKMCADHFRGHNK